MSYRNPRFSFVHTIVTTGDAGYHASTSAFDATDPRTRMADYQSKLNAITTGTGAIVIEYSRESPLAAAWDLHRLIIPSMTVARDRLVAFGLEQGVSGSPETPADVDNAAVLDYWAPATFLDLYFEGISLATWEAEESGAFQLDFESNGVAAAALGIGELWWTNVMQPTTGIARSYTDAIQPTHTRVTMESGADFTKLQGPPRRRFTLRHEAMEEADRRSYAVMLDHIGAGSTPFWYEHPDSGNAKTVIHDLAETGDVAGSTNVTLAAVSTSPNYHAGNVVEATTTTTSACSLTMAVSPALDLRDHVIGLDFWEAQNNVTAATFLQIAVTDSRGAASTFNCGGSMMGADFSTNYIRVEVDLADTPDSASGTSVNGADLSSVAFISLVYDQTGIGDTFRVANLTVTDKTKRPVLVQLDGPARWTQASPVPSGGSGALWTLDMAMIESTS